MLRRILLTSIFIVLAYGFWLSPNFKEIAAGVAIFLFGMLFLEEGFRAFTGGLLENLLKRTTGTLGRSLTFGIVSTSIMQSSSLVSVITISFLSAGLIDLAAGIGIIFGANVGTTTGAWLIAGFGLKVKISAYAMPMLVFGVILVFQKSSHLKGCGYVLGGLGLLFLGIHHMKAGFEAFRTGIDLTKYAVEGYTGVVLFTLVGAAATVIMQSSHATLVLIITGLGAGQVTYENALGLAIGANIGTTITAILGAVSADIQGRRLAGAHLIFNGTTALIAIALIYQLGQAVDLISRNIGIAADNYTLKLAVFHTLFNVIGVVVMVPFIGKLVKDLERMLPGQAIGPDAPRYLTDATMELGDTAIEAVRKETLHLYENAFRILAHGLSLHRHDIRSKRDLEEVASEVTEPIPLDIDATYEATIKGLYGEILAYISRAQVSLTPEQADQLFALRAAGRDIVEAIKDTKHLQKNLERFIASPNLDIRKEYNRIRSQLGEVLRQIDEAREAGGDPAIVMALDTVRVEMEEEDSTRNGRLERLIREGRLTPEMATSLMNDTAYAYDVIANLVDMADALFAPDTSLREARETMRLERAEIDALKDASADESDAEASDRAAPPGPQTTEAADESADTPPTTGN